MAPGTLLTLVALCPLQWRTFLPRIFRLHSHYLYSVILPMCSYYHQLHQFNSCDIMIADTVYLFHPTFLTMPFQIWCKIAFREREQTVLAMKAYLQRLGLEEEVSRLRVIHVTGTKGKGSVCAYCESILRSHGLRTGRLYFHETWANLSVV